MSELAINNVVKITLAILVLVSMTLVLAFFGGKALDFFKGLPIFEDDGDDGGLFGGDGESVGNKGGSSGGEDKGDVGGGSGVGDTSGSADEDDSGVTGGDDGNVVLDTDNDFSSFRECLGYDVLSLEVDDFFGDGLMNLGKTYGNKGRKILVDFDDFGVGGKVELGWKTEIGKRRQIYSGLLLNGGFVDGTENLDEVEGVGLYSADLNVGVGDDLKMVLCVPKMGWTWFGVESFEFSECEVGKFCSEGDLFERYLDDGGECSITKSETCGCGCSAGDCEICRSFTFDGDDYGVVNKNKVVRVGKDGEEKTLLKINGKANDENGNFDNGCSSWFYDEDGDGVQDLGENCESIQFDYRADINIRDAGLVSSREECYYHEVGDVVEIYKKRYKLYENDIVEAIKLNKLGCVNRGKESIVHHPRAFVSAIISQESTWNCNLLSFDGFSQGMMQVNYGQHKEGYCDVNNYDLYAVEDNLKCGVQVIKLNEGYQFYSSRQDYKRCKWDSERNIIGDCVCDGNSAVGGKDLETIKYLGLDSILRWYVGWGHGCVRGHAYYVEETKSGRGSNPSYQFWIDYIAELDKERGYNPLKNADGSLNYCG